MVRPFLSAADVAAIEGLRQQGFATVQQFWRDTFALWTLDRPVGTWDAGTVLEGWLPMGTGTGRLYEQGPGGVTADEAVIVTESPYRLRLLASAFAAVATEPGDSAPDLTNLYAVVNGARLFRVDSVKTEDRDDRLATAYLTELFDRPLPDLAGFGESAFGLNAFGGGVAR